MVHVSRHQRKLKNETKISRKKNVMLKYSITGATAGETEERVMEDERQRINTMDNHKLASEMLKTGAIRK